MKYTKKERDSLYKTRYWLKTRRSVIQQHPLCVLCLRQGKLAKADCVDHIKPHRGFKRLFYCDPRMLQPLCYRCHNSEKQASECPRPGRIRKLKDHWF